VAAITVYRGQKAWSPDMEICAPSLRRALGPNDPELWTSMLLANVAELIRKTEAGDESARQQLEQEVLHAQQAAYHNPYVSCTHSWGIAQSFALAQDTPGYVLTISGEWQYGVDFRDLRNRHKLFGDAVDALQEFGIPRRLEYPFDIDEVMLVAPFGQPTTRVLP
jgi:hypothetical protein